MTEIGRAVLFIYHADGKVNADEFVESDKYSPDNDPYHRAAALWASCEQDFPDAIYSIGMNARARALMGETRMRQMGFTENTADLNDFAKKHNGDLEAATE